VILPAKHLSTDRALITLGAELLTRLDRPKTVSALWNTTRRLHQSPAAVLTFDWFVLALDILFAFGAVALVDGKIMRVEAGT